MSDCHWYWRPKEQPKPIRTPAECGTSNRLFIACTQTSLPPKQQKSLIAEWCEILPTLNNVSEIRFLSHVPQKLFNAACRVPNLVDLHIKWSNIKTIEAAAGATSLQYLHIGSSPSLTSIQTLSEMRSLKWLGLENLRAIEHVDPVGELTDLEGLSLEGSTWSTWKVVTLAPLASLSKLRYLSLVNLRAEDRTLVRLYGLRNLRTFHSATWWNAEELSEMNRLTGN